MKRALIAVFAFAAIIYSIYVSAAMSCSITDAASCTGTLVLKLSDLNDGGSHVGLPAGSSFTKAVCCSGVPGLAVSEASGEEIGWVSSTDDAHMSKTGTGAGTLYLTAPTTVTCTYNPDTCLGGNTCLLSISGDTDAHVSGCEPDEFPFSGRLCCRAGEGGCSIDEFYWGVMDESGLHALAEPEPLGPVGLGMDVFLIAETSGCTGSTADFTIYTEGGDVFKSGSEIQDIPLGSYKIRADTGEITDGEGNPIPNAVIAGWVAGNGDEEPSAGNYKFKLTLTSAAPAYTVESGYSSVVEVSASCGMSLADLEAYFVCTAPDTPPGCCGETMPPECSSESAECPGGFCRDRDCDGVPDCIPDTYIGTVADPSMVDRCSGAEAGTTGCVPSMDCTDLAWSECKPCEAGQLCETDGGFSAGDQYMERCEVEGEAECSCKWAGGAAPPGCTDPVLNQWNNRFKACIEEEEFPVFTGFNVVAVLLVLSVYYTIVVARKKKAR